MKYISSTVFQLYLRIDGDEGSISRLIFEGGLDTSLIDPVRGWGREGELRRDLERETLTRSLAFTSMMQVWGGMEETWEQWTGRMTVEWRRRGCSHGCKQVPHIGF